MGSWNETCMLSGLPIVPGDEVVMLLLTKNPFTNFSTPGCYKNDFFFVRSIPLFGEYADYGEMTLLKGEQKKFELVKRQFALDLISQDKNERDRLLGIPNVEIKNMTFEVFLDWLHEGHVRVDANYFITKSSKRHNERTEKLIEEALEDIASGPPVISEEMSEPEKKILQHRIKNWDKYIQDVTERQGLYAFTKEEPSLPVPVAKIYIRKNVWDSICEMTLEGWDGPANIQKYKADAKKWISDSEKVLKKMLAENLSPESIEFRREVGLAKLERDSIFGSLYGPGASSCGGEPPFAMGNKELVKMVSDDYETGKITKKAYQEVCLRLVELAFVESVMSHTRQTWHLTTGTGSQSDNWETTTELHLRLAHCGADGGMQSLLRWYEDTNLDSLTKEEIEEMDSWDRKNFEKAKALKQIKEALDALLKV